ncbi:hypothetical protein [Nocardia sp. NPDC019395]|uniref:hypothetical protein n=1 Tax=Nocardia sp. NPDC019395 TaxID=3154686 RepID=UPI0033F656EA
MTVSTPAPAQTPEASSRPRSGRKWDPLRWYPDTIVLRSKVRLAEFKAWLAERPWRRRLFWTLVLAFVFVIFPAIIGAVATAQVSSGVSQIDGLGWMNIRDSHGVPLSSYTFSTDRGSIINPANTVLWTLIGLMFVGYISFVTSGIWVIDFTFSFTWLDMFANALTGVADALARQLTNPIILVTSATGGAFFVAIFIVRGLPGKATIQVVTMVGVAVLGPVFLAEPLEDVLSSGGILTQGRDVGLSVAAGLTGDSNPNPNQLVTEMQHNLADNFARKPVQVWNFGQVVDNYPACESAWSSGVLSGQSDNIRDGMKDCGNGSAYAKASEPTMGQVGTGLILLVCAVMLLVFAVYLSVKVTKAALNAIYHGFMAIFGFAAGGFIYGPTQTFLVRNIVDSFIAAVRMTVFTIFLGVYTLFLKNLFDQANGQVMSVLVIVCVVEAVAISQVGRLNSSLSRGNDWIANRASLALHGAGGGSGGSGGGTALGMGGGGAGGGGGSGGALSGVAALAALNTVNSSPVTGWMLAATPNPLNPLARGRKRSEMANIATADSRRELYRWGELGRANWLHKARRRAETHEGMAGALGVANALDGLGDSRVPDAQIAALLRAAGTPDDRVHQVLRAQSAMQASMMSNPYAWGPLRKALAASRAVENHLRPTDSQGVREAFGAQAVVAAENFARHTNAPPPGALVNHGFINRVRQHWDSDTALRDAITPDEWNAVGRDTRWTIGTEAAVNLRTAAQNYYNDRSEANRVDLTRWSTRVANLAHPDPADGLDPWNY